MLLLKPNDFPDVHDLILIEASVLWQSFRLLSTSDMPICSHNNYPLVLPFENAPSVIIIIFRMLSLDFTRLSKGLKC